MKYIKLYENFLNEAASATSLWQDEAQMLQDCKSFLMSNIPFKYSDIVHPEHGYGAMSDDFTSRGTVNLQVIPKDALYYQFSRYIKPSGLLDMEYRRRRSEYIKMGGGSIDFRFFSGSSAINRGVITMTAGGEYYKVGNYEDPNGFSNMMKKIWPGMKDSNNDEQFEQYMSDLNMPIIAARVIDSAWPKEWRAQK